MKKTIALIKFLFTAGLFCVLTGLVILRENDIKTIFKNYITPKETKIVLGEKNSYYRDYDFIFVQNTDNFSPKNFQDILNIYYTVLNAGKTTFTFYCPKEYTECLEDIQRLANNQELLSDINNYVHPYNGFSHIETEYNSIGKVTISIIKSYKEEQINRINEKIDALYPTLVQENLSQQENIRNIHDYIINTTKYDSDRSDNNIFTYQSDIAFGPLLEGFAVCGGYTDLMELFLEKMKIKSYKVSSENHIWNAVLLDNNNWYHLDLTWDDPVASDGKDYLDYTYYLIDTNRLLTTEVTQHNFNAEHYPELN